MKVDELAAFTLQRIAASDGLTIDAATWTAAHAYHETVQRLHARILHGWGIVTGLEVLPTDPLGSAVILRPGVAIDYDGAVIYVPYERRVELQYNHVGVTRIVLRFADAPVQPAGNGAAPRVADSYQIVETSAADGATDLEIARIETKGVRAQIRQASDRWAPELSEIDLRFRRELAPSPPTLATLTIGQLALPGAATNQQHRDGLIAMLRELRAMAPPFAVRFIGDIPAEGALGACDLLYVTGAGVWRPEPAQAVELQNYLNGGGAIFAEPCVAQETQQEENGRFAASVQQVMDGLKHPLEELDQTHPLFGARYIFGLPPEGAGGHAPLQGYGRVILNPNDYGCYWQGRMGTTSLPRAVIRDAMEFAANLAWFVTH